MFRGFNFFILSLILSTGCSSYNKVTEQPFGHSDSEVNKVLQRAFTTAGGMEQYNNLRSISYKKRSILYHANGSTDSDVTQFHEYNMAPALSATVFWMKDGQRHSIKYENGAAKKYLDGKSVPGSEESATKSFLSAHYVLFMPFKLADDHVKLSYEGQDQLRSGQKVDVIKAVYQPASHDNHSADDTWWYYFDVESGAYAGSMVYHAPTYAYIENTAKNEKLPLIMNTYRKSFRVDENRKIEYLRGEFFYEDYEMSFKD